MKMCIHRPANSFQKLIMFFRFHVWKRSNLQYGLEFINLAAGNAIIKTNNFKRNSFSKMDGRNQYQIETRLVILSSCSVKFLECLSTKLDYEDHRHKIRWSCTHQKNFSEGLRRSAYLLYDSSCILPGTFFQRQKLLTSLWHSIAIKVWVSQEEGGGVPE